jgi:chemotaxis protein CheD
MAIQPNTRLPQALPGFEHIKRAWNDTYGAYSARLKPGEFYVTKNDEGIYTTLGSCISACMRDRVSGIGGMNHFMLPASVEEGSWKTAGLGSATRYGNFAMEYLINEILKNGGSRKNLEVKLFGGGCIVEKMSNIGMDNIDFAHDYIKTEGLHVTSEDLGDIFPRMVVYFPATGKVRVKRLRSLHNNTVVELETNYLRTIEAKPVSGEIELF